jgi:hypothetical protein
VASPSGKKNVHQRVRKLDGVVVQPVLYNGNAIGHGKYYAGNVNGQLVEENGRPVPFREIGELVWV